MEGWLKLHRKLTAWEWYKDVPVKTLFIHLLICANYQPTRYQGKEYEAGELITTLGSLADGCGLSMQQTRTALDKLESTGEITKTSTNKITFIKVHNYGNYQGYDLPEQQTNNKQITNEQQTNNKQITNDHTIIKENKNTRNKEYKKYIFTAPTVDEVKAYCLEKNYNNVDAEQFVDFYSSKGWTIGKSKMKDWKASVRTWHRRHLQEQSGKWNGTDSQYDNQF